MKLKSLIFLFIGLLLTGEEGKTEAFLQTNPYFNVLVTNYILSEENKCLINKDSCLQASYNELNQKGFDSYYKKQKTCKSDYEKCLIRAQRQCKSQCPARCPHSQNLNRNGNGNACALTCAQKCQ